MQHWNSPTGEGTIRANVHVLKVGLERDARWIASRTKQELADFETLYKSPSHPEPGMRLAITYCSGDPSQRHLWEKMEYYDYLTPFVDVDGTRPIDDPHIAVGAMARARWEVFKPHFDRWFAGQAGDVPVNGVPLETWLADTSDAQRLAVLKSIGLRSVEEFIRAPESTYIAIASRMPDVRRYRELAIAFLRSRELSAHQSELGAKDEELQTLRSELDELKDMMREMLSAKIAEQGGDGGEQQKRRPGRPTNAERAARDEAEVAA